MSAEKYVERTDEVERFVKHVQGMIGELDLVFQQGVQRLDFGMDQWRNVDKMPSFDSTARKPPYSWKEKNHYIDASNNLWDIHVWQKMHIHPSISELYYAALLRRIKEFTKSNEGSDFNKGIVYANLGVAQSAQMKLEEGFANILKALIEDYPYSDTDPQSSVWKSPLFTQFEKEYVRKPLQAMISQLNIAAISSVADFVESFLSSLSNDQRAFFEYTFIRVMRNQEIWKEKENGLTANRLLAYTQDLCLFNEDFLKSKFANPGAYGDLERLLTEAGKQVARFSVDLNDCGASDMTELDRKLPLLLYNPNQPEKCLRTLLTLRNYSSHNVGGGSSANCFYSCYDEILRELIRAIYEITSLPKLK
jgi:CRISPR/Cas system CSM-associated protein Csm2 small subunit